MKWPTKRALLRRATEKADEAASITRKWSQKAKKLDLERIEAEKEWKDAVKKGEEPSETMEKKKPSVKESLEKEAEKAFNKAQIKEWVYKEWLMAAEGKKSPESVRQKAKKSVDKAWGAWENASKKEEWPPWLMEMPSGRRDEYFKRHPKSQYI